MNNSNNKEEGKEEERLATARRNRSCKLFSMLCIGAYSVRHALLLLSVVHSILAHIVHLGTVWFSAVFLLFYFTIHHMVLCAVI